mmetsp:Transcript_34412/g.78451  ORF Transcript_34412/g.78451 Transcript_34412/m.78451 type:complete len:450 (-) Transcript_34412:227-1576(-)
MSERDSSRKGGGRASRFIKGSNIPKPANFEGDGVQAIILHPLSVLLLLLPFGLASRVLGWGDVWTFFLNFFAMVPLAKILGDATEELAAGLKNDMLAGLLNATFGNAVEMVIMVQTLRAGLFDVVKATLLGSVLSNTLLVLGMSFLFGGIVGTKKKAQEGDSAGYSSMGALNASTTAAGSLEPLPEGAELEVHAAETEFVAEKVQYFHVMNALVNISMLLLSALTLSLVTVFQYATTTDDRGRDSEWNVVQISRVCSLFIISAYVAYIIFQLFTHREALADEEGDDDEEEEGAHISITSATIILCCTTVVVACCSELLVDALEGVTKHAGIGKHFIGIILLPIVGNACEHAAAVRFAIQDKTGLAIGIAIGSSTQISLFVVPCSVLIGWAMGLPMDLDFGPLNTIVATLSVIVILSMVVDGSSNWLSGYLLCVSYAIVAVLYWHVPEDW